MPWLWVALAAGLALFAACVFVNWVLTKEDKPKMNIAMPAWTLGAVIALVVAILAAVLLIVGHTSLTIAFALIIALAVARLT